MQAVVQVPRTYRLTMQITVENGEMTEEHAKRLIAGQNAADTDKLTTYLEFSELKCDKGTNQRLYGVRFAELGKEVASKIFTIIESHLAEIGSPLPEKVLFLVTNSEDSHGVNVLFYDEGKIEDAVNTARLATTDRAGRAARATFYVDYNELKRFGTHPLTEDVWYKKHVFPEKNESDSEETVSKPEDKQPEEAEDARDSNAQAKRAREEDDQEK